MIQSSSSPQVHKQPACTDSWIRNRHQLIHRDSIAEHILQVLGQPATKIEPVHDGCVHIVFQASVGDRTVYLKTATEERSMSAEVRALELVAKQRISAPRIVHYGRLNSQTDVSCLILTPLSGDNAAHLPASRRNTVYEQTGRLLLELHRIQVDNFGRLSSRHLTKRSWEDSVTHQMLNDAGQLSRTGRLKQNESAALQRIIDDAVSRGLLAVSTPRLLHMDIQSHHIFADEEDQIGLIDFHKASGGDPLFDLVTFSCYEGTQALPYLLRGYTHAMKSTEQKHFDLRLRQVAPFYRIGFVLSKIAWKAAYFQNIKILSLVGDYERNQFSTS